MATTPAPPESGAQRQRPPDEDCMRFGFGDNWADYIANL